MYSLNRAQIIGNVTRDPEMRYTPNGQAVCSLGVATNRRWRDKDGNNQEQTEFHNVVAWGKLAEIINQYVKKGNKIYVEGRLQTRQWEAQDGSKRSRTEIVMENFVFLTPKGAITEVGPTETEIEEFPEPEEEKTEKETPKTKKIAEKEEKNAEENEEEEINLDDIPF